jgi:hypothetical protein
MWTELLLRVGAEFAVEVANAGAAAVNSPVTAALNTRDFT